jgi:hypothetical protein
MNSPTMLDKILMWFATVWILLVVIFNIVAILGFLVAAPTFWAGFEKVREVYGPFNIWNWLFEIAILSPALIALTWLDRRRKNSKPMA